MHLLRFTFENHRSFRDEATLDLTRPTLKTLRPSKGTEWTDHIHHVDGIYGANASGKTNVLDALHYMLGVIGSSATSWLDEPQFPRAPFALIPEQMTAPATFELEFIYSGQRYDYRFATDSDGITEESLHVVSTRWKEVYSRNTDGRVKGLKGITRVARRELALSRAAQFNHASVTPIWEALMRGFDLYHVGDGEVNARIDRIARQLKERSLNLSALVTLAQIADTGITHVEVEEHAIPPRFAQLVAQMLAPASDDRKNGGWRLPPTTVRNRLVIARQTKSSSGPSRART